MEESDLLDKLIHGKITSDEADDIGSAVLSDTSQTTPAHEILGLSQKEWTAYAHGADFEDFPYWRQHGWPYRCFVCGGKIDSDNFGWLAREFGGKISSSILFAPRLVKLDDDRT
ncbi:hypothetical protein [Cupriavidus taiwanensis]|uniref:hypothetical protein n=1 Tax=Cupriavidus taiwanensis TaxID=164546 RepID=UPI0011C04BDF|nr:hypothetical protein [Cupriavidus taiwanensis]